MLRAINAAVILEVSSETLRSWNKPSQLKPNRIR